METTVDWACEDRDEKGFPFDAESEVVLIVDRPAMVLTGEGDEEPKTDLKGKLELYMFTVDFGEVGVAIVMDDLSGTDPGVGTGGVLEENEVESPVITTGSVPGLTDEDPTLAVT